METLIIKVDFKSQNRVGPPQLGITVEAPKAVQQRQQQALAAAKDYRNHDYQNFHALNNNDKDNGRNKINNNNNNQNGIASVSAYNTSKNNVHKGLQITQIQEGSVIDKNGQFRIGDIIIEVNGISLQNKLFDESQQTLRKFVIEQSSPLLLKVLRKAPSSSSLPSTTGSQITVMERSLSTRRLGTKHRINITKGNGGFGIKIAERDNTIGATRPIYITAITTTGSAYRDGRLKEGDMLLEINNVDLSGKSQPEVTKILKDIKVNQTVELVVSRQDDSTSAETTTNQLDDSVFMEPIHTDGPGDYVYDIPLNDTVSAGLGLHLKKPSLDGKDLGIWINHVLTEGAAYKDGRLQPDDQILAINGIELTNLSNTIAFETLVAAVRKAPSNTIRLKIRRRDPSVVARVLQKAESSQGNHQSIFDSTLGSQSQHDTSESSSALSPQTQASNSCNDKSDPNSSKTNDTLSAISQTELTTVPIIDSQTALTLPKTFELSDKMQQATTASSIQSWDDESIDAATGEEVFQRDGFGRQSISEKRHAQLMATSTDTYKRNQKLRLERERQRQLEEQFERQCLDDKKRYSVREGQHVPRIGTVRIARNRKLNESFRAAVDRSYEGNMNFHGISDQRKPEILSITNSTTSTSNDERFLIYNNNGFFQDSNNNNGIVNNNNNIVETSDIEYNTNNNIINRNTVTNSTSIANNHSTSTINSGAKSNNHSTHKKSSSILTKFLKFGSLKKSKSKQEQPRKQAQHQQVPQQHTHKQEQQSEHQQHYHHQQQQNHYHHQHQQHHQQHHQQQHQHQQQQQQQQQQQHQQQQQQQHHQYQQQQQQPEQQRYSQIPIQLQQAPYQNQYIQYQARNHQMLANPQHIALSNGCPPQQSSRWQAPPIHSPNGLWVANPPVTTSQMHPHNHYMHPRTQTLRPNHQQVVSLAYPTTHIPPVIDAYQSGFIQSPNLQGVAPTMTQQILHNQRPQHIYYYDF